MEAVILWRLRLGPMSDEQLHSYCTRLGRDYPDRDAFKGFAGVRDRSTQPARSRLVARGLVAEACDADGVALKARNAGGNAVKLWVAL